MTASAFDGFFKRLPYAEQLELAGAWIRGEVVPGTAEIVKVFRDRLFCLAEYDYASTV